MADGSPNRLRSAPWLVALLAFALLAVVLSIGVPSPGPPAVDRSLLSESHNAVAAMTGNDSDLQPGVDGLYPTIIRRPAGPPTVKLTTADPQGRVGEIACSTCHSVREPNYETRTAGDLDQFHQNMPFGHGKLACYACHNPEDADSLRLADTSRVEFADVMTLCSQCHGQQATDYKHGAHGGMNGYWDLTRGPRTRNNCIDCHDPHVPAFPKMQPTFKPRDRFLDANHVKDASHSGAGSIQKESEAHGE